jgi:hypothetical protein
VKNHQLISAKIHLYRGHPVPVDPLERSDAEIDVMFAPAQEADEEVYKRAEAARIERLVGQITNIIERHP